MTFDLAHVLMSNLCLSATGVVFLKGFVFVLLLKNCFYINIFLFGSSKLLKKNEIKNKTKKHSEPLRKKNRVLEKTQLA